MKVVISKTVLKQLKKSDNFVKKNLLKHLKGCRSDFLLKKNGMFISLNESIEFIGL